MDDKWFKAQQKKVGITAEAIAAVIGRDRSVVSKILSGKQRMTLEWAQAFATALEVDLATVLEKAGVADAPVVQAVMPGFSESDAAPWVPKSEGTEGRSVPTVAEALGGGRPGIDVWRVKGTAMSQHGLLPGDYMLVDTHQAERVKPGDVVVAQVYNRTGATTVLRTYAPPVLMSADPADTQVQVVDGVNVVIRGKVTASWRV
jgi:SOS-response transcriptional repressor LexA